MSKRKVTGDDLRAMMASPRTLPELDTLDTEGCWIPLIEDYRTELLYRELTRLRREKALLRAALTEAVETAKKLNRFNLTYTSTRWEERILDRTK